MRTVGRFHDGFFEGFWIEASCVHIYLSTYEKERYIVIAEGVVALSAGGFRAGNVIFDVVIREHDEITSSDIESVYDLVKGPAGEKQRSQLLDRARKEKLRSPGDQSLVWGWLSSIGEVGRRFAECIAVASN